LRVADPLQVVGDLLADVRGAFLQHRFEHITGDAVARLEVLRIAARAYPPERPETVIEAQRAHDVLHVAGVAELCTLRTTDLGTRALALQQEGVAVVEEVHAFRAASVLIGCHLSRSVSCTRSLNPAGSFTMSALLSS
jgi:hypothetical protein